MIGSVPAMTKLRREQNLLMSRTCSTEIWYVVIAILVRFDPSAQLQRSAHRCRPRLQVLRHISARCRRLALDCRCDVAAAGHDD